METNIIITILERFGFPAAIAIWLMWENVKYKERMITTLVQQNMLLKMIAKNLGVGEVEIEKGLNNVSKSD